MFWNIYFNPLSFGWECRNMEQLWVCQVLNILLWSNTLTWAQMDCAEETNVWRAHLVRVLVSYVQRPMFFFASSEQALEPLWWQLRGEALIEWGVRGDTSESICSSSLHLCFLPVKFITLFLIYIFINILEIKAEPQFSPWFVLFITDSLLFLK